MICFRTCKKAGGVARAPCSNCIFPFFENDDDDDGDDGDYDDHNDEDHDGLMAVIISMIALPKVAIKPLY